MNPKDNIALFVKQRGEAKHGSIQPIRLASVPRVGDYIGLDDGEALVTQVVWARDPGKGNGSYDADVFATLMDRDEVRKLRG